MAIGLENKTNIVPPGGDYPSGRIKNDSGVGDGTPITENVYGDFHQFFAKLLRDNNITPNNTPENLSDGFQYNDALNELITRESAWENLVVPVSVGTVHVTPQVRLVGDLVEFRGFFDISANTGSWEFPDPKYKAVLGGQGVGPSLVVSYMAGAKETFSIQSLPFGNGTISWERLTGSETTFPKSIDISSFRYNL